MVVRARRARPQMMRSAASVTPGSHERERLCARARPTTSQRADFPASLHLRWHLRAIHGFDHHRPPNPGMGSEFLHQVRMGSEFLPPGMGSEFLGQHKHGVRVLALIARRAKFLH